MGSAPGIVGPMSRDEWGEPFSRIICPRIVWVDTIHQLELQKNEWTVPKTQVVFRCLIEWKRGKSSTSRRSVAR